MPSSRSSADELFQQAICIGDESARQHFVEAACASDANLKQELERRLQSHFAPIPVLDETTDAISKQRSEGVPAVGSRIGPYQLLEEIGEGGMGIVFLAQQNEPIVRRVALKVIKVGMDTRRVVARFESERQTMALMDHPCITKVLDAGATETGRPYFVMELVRGLPITRYCDKYRMAVRQRLEVFVQICNAIEHAHQKGIIHRDIKPTNVLVIEQDGFPLPKIIDFGIAKATSDRPDEQTMLTRHGEMVGTPLYMSPEQASDGDVDTRADIYSLGVLLYELLTGTTPFHELKKSQLQEIRNAISTSDPPTASSRVKNMGATAVEISTNRATDAQSLHRTIRGELDWILAKCLARDRDQRYQSAGELAREIQRYMNGEPLDAAAPTFWYRAKKFVAKHRGAVVVTATAAALLALISVYSSWMAVHASALAQRASTAEKLANARLSEVAKERDRAVAAEKRLAQLERQQRNQVAIHQAAAEYNADMMKKYFFKNNDGQAVVSAPGMQLVPLSKLIQAGRPPAPDAHADHELPPLPPDAPGVGGDRPDVGIVTADGAKEPADDLQVVICDDEGECQTSVLKSILQKQQAAFGSKDVAVAVTLNQLGELMSQQGKLGESAEYFAEALDILKDAADDHPELLRVKENLVQILHHRGDVEQALEELKAAKAALNDADVRQSLRAVWDKVKQGLNRKEENK